MLPPSSTRGAFRFPSPGIHHPATIQDLLSNFHCAHLTPHPPSAPTEATHPGYCRRSRHPISSAAATLLSAIDIRQQGCPTRTLASLAPARRLHSPHTAPPGGTPWLRRRGTVASMARHSGFGGWARWLRSRSGLAPFERE